MSHYRKFYVMVIATVLVGLSTFFDINFGIEAESVYKFIITALGALGVVAIRNG